MKTFSWQNTLSRPQMWLLLSALSLMAMEIILATLWYQALFRSVPLGWFAQLGCLAGILYGSFALARAAEAMHWRIVYQQLFFAAWFALTLLGSLRLMIFAGSNAGLYEILRQPVQYITLEGAEGAGFFHLVVISLIIWRGTSLARVPVSLRSIQVSFQVGLILLLIYGMSQAPAHPVAATVGLYSYLFTAMLGMSAARIASLRDARSGRVPRFGSGWLAGILLAALGFIGLAVLTGWLASSRIVVWIVKALALVFTALAALVVALLAPVFSFLGRMISAIIDTLNNLAHRVGQVGLPQFMEDLVINIGQVLEKAIPVLIASRGVFLTAVLILIMVGILLSLRLRAIQLRMETEENSDKIDANDEPGLLKKLADRLFPGGLNIRLRSPGQILAAARIRQIYRQLITLSRKHGVERPPSLTPLEFIPHLAHIFPEDPAGLELITSAYLRVRYGEYPETLREVEVVQRTWDAIRKRAR